MDRKLLKKSKRVTDAILLPIAKYLMRGRQGVVFTDKNGKKWVLLFIRYYGYAVDVCKRKNAGGGEDEF